VAELKSTEVLHTHSITDLVGAAVRADPEFESVQASKKLDQYYVPTRYPNGLPGGVPSRHYDESRRLRPCAWPGPCSNWSRASSISNRLRAEARRVLPGENDRPRKERGHAETAPVPGPVEVAVHGLVGQPGRVALV